MNNLLIINDELKSLISEVSKINNCEILIIKKNFKDVLKKKKNKFSKVILITEKILPRKSETYMIVNEFVENKKSFFIEIGHKKSESLSDKALSNALINGSGNNTKIIIEKIVDVQNA